jgi:hypothetical protein
MRFTTSAIWRSGRFGDAGGRSEVPDAAALLIARVPRCANGVMAAATNFDRPNVRAPMTVKEIASNRAVPVRAGARQPPAWPPTWPQGLCSHEPGSFGP